MKQIFQIISFTKTFWKFYLTSGIFIILVALLNLVGPILSGRIVDEIVNSLNGDKDFTPIVTLLLLVAASDISITFFSNISGHIGDILAAKLNTFLTSKFYRHVLALHIEYFDNEVSGKIINKLQRGIENITSFINDMLNNFLPFFFTAAFTIIILAFYSIEIAILLFIMFPIYILISDRSSKAWMKKQEKINEIQDNAFGRIFEAISSIRIVKSFLRSDLEFKLYKSSRNEIESIAKVQSRQWHMFDVVRNLALNVIIFAIYLYIVIRTFNGDYTLGIMTALLQLVNQARFPLFAMSYILSQIQSAQSGSKDFFEVLNEPVQINDNPNALELKNVKGHIKFKDVSFAYKNSKEVLHQINFDLKAGEKLALVGESGEGKSTIANLLLRFYEPQEGEILIDDINIKDVTQKSLHKNVAVVLQDSILFSGTIADNIRYGKEDATMEEIIEAAQAANAHAFISNFEKGYDTEIGERGIKLSGGQKQRISIARAILKNSPILILDEATSSLDSKAEAEVQKALDKLMENRTTIIIAHRLATIRSVDQILVLKGGKIAEKGIPDELVKQNGIYAELVRLQSTIAGVEKSKVDDKDKKKLKEFNLVE